MVALSGRCFVPAAPSRTVAVRASLILPAVRPAARARCSRRASLEAMRQPSPSSMRMITSSPASAATAACAMTIVSPRSLPECIRWSNETLEIRWTAAASSGVTSSDSISMSRAGSLLHTVPAARKRGSWRALRRISVSTVSGTLNGPMVSKRSRSLCRDRKLMPGPASMMGRPVTRTRLGGRGPHRQSRNRRVASPIRSPPSSRDRVRVGLFPPARVRRWPAPRKCLAE